ncbi:uncharacterized protein [Lepeophtheirus salmonis]|uniref:uncharacterized protein n=1 Tax=Lepeophtheirus salmonis TaxID=72036 RepID=UPI001AE2EE39|nr:uncharacterized protein LOC121130353 [Lepeophtheirus salmonis]
MCILCFDTKWRSIVIGIVSSLIPLSIFFITIPTQDSIHHAIQKKFDTTEPCMGNACVYYVFDILFPAPLWITLLSYSVVNALLVGFSLYKWVPGVTFYLTLDAIYVGIIGMCLCLSFFTEGLTRITLLTLLFPSFSLALCAWMSIFGFYIRLEESATKRAKARRMILDCHNDIESAQRLQQQEYLNLAYDPDEDS